MSFADIYSEKNEFETTMCVIHLGGRQKMGKTLIGAVNEWIRQFNKHNKKVKCDGKQKE